MAVPCKFEVFVICLSSSNFVSNQKILGEKIKIELSRIQSELNTSNPNLKFS